MTVKNASICGIEPSTAFHPGTATPFELGGKVVAKTSVGLGAPETVTVAAVESVVAVVLAVDPIENLGDVAYMMPDVELRKRRK